MSRFVPFRAYHPVKERVAEVVSKPYDVLNREEALEECEGNPVSFYHVIKPEIDFPAGHDQYAPEIYRKGKENFDQLVRDGIVVHDASEQFFIYQLSQKGHSQTGIAGCCAIKDYFDDVIKKHELTRPDKEEDRKNHIRASKLNYEPVFFSYPQVNAIDQQIEAVKSGEPEYDFETNDGIKHRVWPVKEEGMIRSIIRLFEEKVPKIYVADGHHRTAAGALAGQEFVNGRAGNLSDGKRDNYFLAVLFPDDQLEILDYNRVIKDLNGLLSEEFLERLSNDFVVEQKVEQHRPAARHTFGMYLDQKWYQLTAKPGICDDTPIGQLDVTILTQKVLEPVLNIMDVRTDKRIDFVGGIRGLGELERRVDSGEMKVAFALHPVSMQQIITIADSGLTMPPKVTWFEPKLGSGLFVYSLGEE
jgi:uncharacterized protein (DUF1015 family)